ncbi:Hypothetical protein POVR1_LOCUS93 [uncultured virus]|nr:Hypothetical protein POVR1_LOCUS93 [uncultured virus]
MDKLPAELLRKIFADQDEYITKAPTKIVRQAVDSDINQLILGHVKEKEFARYLEGQPNSFFFFDRFQDEVLKFEFMRIEDFGSQQETDGYTYSLMIDILTSTDVVTGDSLSQIITMAWSKDDYRESVWNEMTTNYPIQLDMFTTYQIMKRRSVTVQMIKTHLASIFDNMMKKPPTHCAIELYVNLSAFNMLMDWKVEDLHQDVDTETNSQYINRLKLMIEQMSPLLKQRLMELSYTW